MSFKLIAKVRAKPGKEKELEASYREMIKAVRANEPGCEYYIMHRSIEDPTLIVWWESYKDKAAFDLHIGTEHMKATRARNASLVQGPAEATFITEIDRK